MDAYLQSFDGTKIFYKYEKGDHPVTLVFLHGVGGNWTIWKKEIEFFQRLGFATLALDLRGHGRSDAPEAFEKYKMPYFCRDLDLILTKEKIKNFALLCLSFGGAIAIGYCALYPKYIPAACVFVDSAATYPFKHDKLLNMNPYVTHLLRFIASHKLTRKQHTHLDDVDLSEKGIKKNMKLLLYLLHITPLQIVVKTLDNAETYIFKNQQRIFDTVKCLKAPTLIIQATNDKTIYPHFTKQIQKLNKKAELKILKNASHHVTAELPEEVSRIIFEFLREKNLFT